jgi:hypothetical protein
MIEKLPQRKIDFGDIVVDEKNDERDKINELVEAVNELQKLTAHLEDH